MFGLFGTLEEDNQKPDLHIGTIKCIPPQFSGLQTVMFDDHPPVMVENYGHRRLIEAANHLGQDTPNGMRIEFSMDYMGFVMETFQILGNKTHVACYNCQTIMETYRVADKEEQAIMNSIYGIQDLVNDRYSMCTDCGRIYCPECQSEPCKYCEFMKQFPESQ